MYGLPGVGKTYDMCRCFRGGITLLTDRDGLRAVQTRDGKTPRHVRLSDRTEPLVEVRKVLTEVIKPLVAQKKATAVLVCTATELADRVLMARLQTVKDPRQAYQQARVDFLDLTYDLLDLGVWVVYECHEVQPGEEDYRIRPGGPKFPGRTLEEDVVYAASIVLRAQYDTAGDRVYTCEPSDAMWRMKDRYNICERQQPMELLALMKKTVGSGGAVRTEGEKA